MAPAVTVAVASSVRSGHLPALTGLRFFLALWVIVNHLVGKGHVYEPVALMLPGPLQAIMRGGYLAVPTFFVLSGFVLARTYASTSWNPVERVEVPGRSLRSGLSGLRAEPADCSAVHREGQRSAERLAGSDAPDAHAGMVGGPLYSRLEHSRLDIIVRDVLLPDVSAVDCPNEKVWLGADHRCRVAGLRDAQSDVGLWNLRPAQANHSPCGFPDGDRSGPRVRSSYGGGSVAPTGRWLYRTGLLGTGGDHRVRAVSAKVGLDE